jgi:hypothetical protein
MTTPTTRSKGRRDEMASTKTWARAVIAAAAIGCGVMTAATPAADGQPTDTCTAGWLVHDANGQPGLLTAGHCDYGGAVTYFNTATGFEVVGWFTHRVYDGDTAGDDDIAVLGIGNGTGVPEVPNDTRIIGIRPVTAPANDTHLADGQQLCHYGLITGSQHGGPKCGPIVSVAPTRVRFLAHVEKGDSGGPAATQALTARRQRQATAEPCRRSPGTPPEPG